MYNLIKQYSIRKVFLTVTFVILLLILIVRFYVLPSLYPEHAIILPAHLEIASSVLDNLFASLLVTVLIALFYFWLIEKKGEENFEFIAPISIKDKLKKNRLHTDYWNYSGGTGRYTRAITIPELAKLARSRNSQVSFRILILDPNDEDICKDYATYRHSLKSGREEKWDKKYVRRNCLSTILTCAVWKEKEPLIDISVGLKNNYSLFRIDQASNSVIVTREDPQEPAIFAANGTQLYKFYKDEFHQAFRQSREIQIPLDFFNFENLEIGKVEDFFDNIGLNQNLGEEDFREIIRLTREAENPYD